MGERQPIDLSKERVNKIIDSLRAGNQTNLRPIVLAEIHAVLDGLGVTDEELDIVIPRPGPMSVKESDRIDQILDTAWKETWETPPTQSNLREFKPRQK